VWKFMVMCKGMAEIQCPEI